MNNMNMDLYKIKQKGRNKYCYKCFIKERNCICLDCEINCMGLCYDTKRKKCEKDIKILRLNYCKQKILEEYSNINYCNNICICTKCETKCLGQCFGECIDFTDWVTKMRGK